MIYPDNLPLELRQEACSGVKPGPSKKLEAGAVAVALQQAGGNKSKAAKLLGVGRATLYRFLAERHAVS